MSRAFALGFFVRQGWTPEQSAGIVANLEAESGLRPDAVGDGGQAYGIAQWHPPRQSNFLALMGKAIQGSSLEDQLYFVHAELRGTEKHAGDLLAECTSASQAAAMVCAKYERPADIEGESAKRGALAERIFAGMGEPFHVPPVENAPAPIKEESMPLLAALLPSILSLFAPRAQAAISKVTGQPADVSAAFLADLFGKIQQATGQAEPIQAAAALQTAPIATVKEVEDHAMDFLDKIGPLMDKAHQYQKDEWAASEDSTDRAAARAIAQQEGGPFTNPTFLIACFVLVLVAVVVGAVLFKGGFSTDMQAFVIGAIVGSALTAVLSFYFGSSRTSAAKDATISQIAQRGTGK